MFYLMPHTHIQIDNNHAKRGGGIYVEDDNVATTISCFFQQLDLQYPHINAVITLVNNTADEAGSAVYGGKIDKCLFYTNNQLIMVHGNTVFTIIFRIISIPSAESQVSSNPIKVHVCKHKDHFQSGVYPGQVFKIPVVLHGQRNGSVPGIVCGELVNKSRGARFASLQDTQTTGYSCTNLTYTIFSIENYEQILLRVDGIIFNEEKSHILINMTLLPCPPGFQLSSLTAQCECAPLLKERDLLCNISGPIPLVRRTSQFGLIFIPKRMTPYYMITAHLTTANPFHFGCSLVTQMSSVHMNVQAFSVEGVSLTSVWQLEHHSVWSAQTSTSLFSYHLPWLA